MDETTELINLARICMANDNYDMLKKNIGKINLNYLSGTVFDSNIELSLEKIDRIIKKRKRSRRIKKISEESYNALISKRAIPISTDEFITTFDTIKRNLELFNNKFKDKILRIDSTNGSKDLVIIRTASFFHILGFSLKEWQKRKKSVLKLFPEFKTVLNKSYKEICITNDEILYDALYTLIENKFRILAELEKNNQEIIEAFKMNKVKVKNFLFEKSDPTTFPSCIINRTHTNEGIKGDLCLLRDHINDNRLEWGILSFYAYNPNQPRILKSVLHNYFDNSEVMNFDHRITTSIGCIDKKDFYNISNIEEIPTIIKFNKYSIDYLSKVIEGVNPVVKKRKTYTKREK